MKICPWLYEKQAEQGNESASKLHPSMASVSAPVSSILLWLISYPPLLGWWTVMWKCKPKYTCPFQLAFEHCVLYHSNRNSKRDKFERYSKNNHLSTNKCNTRPTLSRSPVKEITVSKVNSPMSSLIYWINNYMYIESVNVCVCVLPWAQENNLGGQWEERRHKSRRYIYLQKDTQRKKRVKSKILE